MGLRLVQRWRLLLYHLRWRRRRWLLDVLLWRVRLALERRLLIALLLWWVVLLLRVHRRRVRHAGHGGERVRRRRPGS